MLDYTKVANFSEIVRNELPACKICSKITQKRHCVRLLFYDFSILVYRDKRNESSSSTHPIKNKKSN